MTGARGEERMIVMPAGRLRHDGVLLATQYYRPPFPDASRWTDDLARIAATGLDAIQIWACWGWMEPEPGRFVFDDFDRLVDEASANGLGVIISTVAEIQPFWIHRVEPGGAMVDHLGRSVISSLRNECNVGLSPGGCTDHPGVAGRMSEFLTTVAERYAGSDTVMAWDAWNEIRWNVGAGGYTCYCPSTVAAYRAWLVAEYGDLDTLNGAWKRRYSSWEDVWPGRPSLAPYTDLIEFQRFLTWRTTDHLRARADAIRAGDPDAFVTAHCGSPSAFDYGLPNEYPRSRGSDRQLAQVVDGYGCSLFPVHLGFDDGRVSSTIAAVRDATLGRTFWISEMQGGAGNHAFDAERPVEADRQQRWIWDAVGQGAKGVVFWCWRDEVFGSESGGFGLAGGDGHAPERLRRLRDTADVLSRHRSLFAAYELADPEVGVVVDSTNSYLAFAQDLSAWPATAATLGITAALERTGVPYRFIEPSTAGLLGGLRLVFLPWSLVVTPDLAEALVAFVEGGGTIVCEAETAAFDPLGFFRQSGAERTFMPRLGVSAGGRRPVDIETVDVTVDGATFSLRPERWLTALQCERGEPLVVARPELSVRSVVGAGEVVALGTSVSGRYGREPYADYEGFVAALVARAGAGPSVTVSGLGGGVHPTIRTGRSGETALVFVMSNGPAQRIEVALPGGGPSTVVELLGDRPVDAQVEGDRLVFVDDIASGAVAVYAIERRPA